MYSVSFLFSDISVVLDVREEWDGMECDVRSSTSRAWMKPRPSTILRLGGMHVDVFEYSWKLVGRRKPDSQPWIVQGTQPNQADWLLDSTHTENGVCDHSKLIESKYNWSREQSVTIFFILFKENHSVNHFLNSGRIDVFFRTFSGNKWAFLQVEDERKPQLEGQFPAVFREGLPVPVLPQSV